MNFWHSLTKGFEDLGKGIADGAKAVGNVVVDGAEFVGEAAVGATIALGTEKFWAGLGETTLEATEAGLEQTFVILSETPI